MTYLKKKKKGGKKRFLKQKKPQDNANKKPDSNLPVISNDIKAEDLFSSSINAPGKEQKKEYATMPKHRRVVQESKSIKTNKNKEQGELHLLLRKRS